MGQIPRLWQCHDLFWWPWSQSDLRPVLPWHRCYPSLMWSRGLLRALRVDPWPGQRGTGVSLCRSESWCQITLWVLLAAGQCKAAFADLSSWPSQFPEGFSDAPATLGQHLIVGHPCASEERIRQHGKALCSSEKELKVEHQGGHNTGLQGGGVRGQCHDEGWPATNSFGSKKRKREKFPNCLLTVGNAPSCWEAFQLPPLFRAAHF